MFHWNHCSRMYVVRCENGSEKHVYRRVDDAFPLELVGFDVRAAGRFKDAFQDQAELKVKASKMVDAQLFSISERNNGLMMEFRAVYVVFQGDPCKQHEFFSKQVKKIIKEQRKLRALDAKITNLEKEAETRSMLGQEVYRKLIEILEGFDSRKLQKKEIIQAFESSRNALQSLSE